MIEPLAFRWDGEAFVPAHQGWARRADRALIVGQVYNLIDQEERSGPSHRHYFAAIREAWQSLPEHLSEQFPSTEHLRKFALIKAGYADQQSIVASSAAEARRLAAFIRPADEFSIIRVEGATVTRWAARSQSQRAMPKGEFQRSKDAVLEIIAGLIGVEPGALDQHARAA